MKLTCPYCDGTGITILDVCTGQDCEDPTACNGCSERYDTEECRPCEGSGEITQDELKWCEA